MKKKKIKKIIFYKKNLYTFEKTKNMQIQKLSKKFEDKEKLARMYFALLSTLNNLALHNRDLDLLAYTAIKGDISYANSKKEFCEKYKTTLATSKNVISKLKRMGILVKDDNGKIMLAEIFKLNFDTLALFIKLEIDEGSRKENN